MSLDRTTWWLAETQSRFALDDHLSTAMLQMRILFVIGSFVAGGSERQLIEILHRIDRSRFQPLLYSIYDHGELGGEIPSDVPVICYSKRHPVPRWNYPGRILRQQAADLADVLATESIDLVCDRNFNVTLPVAWACEKRPTKRVSIVDCEPTADLKMNLGRFAWLKRWYLRSAYHQADRVVAVSQDVKVGLQTLFGLPDSHIDRIYNFVDVDAIESLRGAPSITADAAAVGEGHRFRIVFAGRLQTQKGLRYLVEALAELVSRRKLTQLHLTLIGQGPIEAELKQLVAERQLDAFVSFAGFQANPLPLMKAADVFCLPSLYEGFSVVLLEAAVLGTPIIATNCPGGNREILQDGRLGWLVPSADSQALANAIVEAVGSEPTRRRYAAAAGHFVRSNFSSPEGVRQYEQLFQTLVPDRPVTSGQPPRLPSPESGNAPSQTDTTARQ